MICISVWQSVTNNNKQVCESIFKKVQGSLKCTVIFILHISFKTIFLKFDQTPDSSKTNIT